MLFDWAEQPFHTLIITFVFAPFFVAAIAPDPTSGQAMWGWATGAGGLIIAILAPVFGALADRSGPRKPWIAGFSVLAFVGAFALYFAAPGTENAVPIALIGFVIAMFGFEFAAIFNNAMMPSLVPRSELGKLSGTGWAIGYVGGVVSLIIVLGFMSASPETGTTILGIKPVFGLEAAAYEGDRASGPLTAIWYVIFVLPLFLFVPDAKNTAPRTASNRQALADLWRTIKRLPSDVSYFAFLMSSMLYRDGLNALFAFGGIYGVGVLGLTIIQIGIFGILAATTGAIGAFVGGRADHRFGPKPVVATSCFVLVVASLAIISTTPDAMLFVVPLTPQSNLPLVTFYVAGAFVGAAGGSLQAASRTLLVDQVEPGKTTEAFGLYALTGRATAFIGPIAVAIVTTMTGSQQGVLPVAILLAAGGLGLFWVKQHQAGPR
ncbi:MAG: MFS transporter [Alphaproteobacteria bacterium]|nr:MFS transporter [Alphaproteobacteria bacterium]